MKVVIALDSFKGSLSSIMAGNTVKRAFENVFSNGESIVFPISDGGEGTVESIVKAMNGEIIRLNVTGPLGFKINSFYGIVNNKTAVIEIAAAAGLTLVPEQKRNPMNTTTYGVGELIIDAVKRGIKDFVIGLGGSATNDGGIGMLSALGVKFIDKNSNICGIFGKNIFDIKNIDISSILNEIKQCNFTVACDVDNPLCGERGASAVFAPQKGADNDMVLNMDKAMFEYAKMSESIIGEDFKNIEGAGAAGGLGFALVAYLNAKIVSGIDVVIKTLDIEKHIKSADVVVTGEGRLDYQTVMGKAPGGVAKIAKKYNVPVIALSGCVGNGAKQCNKSGIDAFFPILREALPLEEAMKSDIAENNLYDTAVQVFNIIKTFKPE